MKTKSGDVIPPDLGTALRANPEMFAKWSRLKPSCQSRYVKLVTSAKRPETRQRRVGVVLRMAADWYARHYGQG